MNRTQCLRICCVSGLVGSVLFLAGDMLFYGTLSSGADFHPYQQMAQRSIETLVLGGAIGPVAALFEALGMGLFALTLEPAGRRIANTVAILFAIMIIVGGSYHAVYTCLGFTSKLVDPTMRDAMLLQVTNLRTTISYPDVRRRPHRDRAGVLARTRQEDLFPVLAAPLVADDPISPRVAAARPVRDDPRAPWQRDPWWMDQRKLCTLLRNRNLRVLAPSNDRREVRRPSSAFDIP
jgi:hypothetical protein